MKKEFRKAVFVIVYSKNKEKKFEYVVLKRKKHWKGREFVKGEIEKGEKKIDTAKRETKEETGLKILKIKKFDISGKYRYQHEFKDRPGIIGQTFDLFAVEVTKGKIRINQKEHYSGEWLSFKKALKKFTWPNQRRCLRIVNKWVNQKK